jgi:DNA polymerase
MFQKALEALGVEVKTKLSPTGKTIPQFSKTDPFMAELLEYDSYSEDGTSADDINYQVQTLAAARLSQKSTLEETRTERFINIAKLPWPAGTPQLPVPLRYGGAHTHRLSGEWSMNMQNLPRDKTRSKLRQALMAPPGHTMITADLAQIEARIVAALCDQGDLVERFRRNEDVYAWFASKVFQRLITKKSHPNERFLGKTAILGLGYGCGVERFIVMVRTQARQYGIPLDGIFDDEIAQEIVDTYRQLFSNIPKSWRRLDHYLSGYINNKLKTQKSSWGPVTFSSGRIRLPNNMYLRYEDTTKLYGAKLLENIVQALARIVVMSAAVRLADQKLRFVMQAHDELVFIVPDDDVAEARALIELEMIREPDWLPGLPLAVELGQGANYGECK